MVSRLWRGGIEVWRGGMEAVERLYIECGVVVWRLWRGGLEAVER